MPYELVKTTNSQCKTFWMILLIFFCCIAFFNNIRSSKYNNSEYFDTNTKNAWIRKVSPDQSNISSQL